MKQICRLDKTNNRPYCLRKPCSYRLDGTCSGPVVAVKDYYSLFIKVGRIGGHGAPSPILAAPARRSLSHACN